MRNFFEKLFGGKRQTGFIFTSRNLANPTGNGDRILRRGGASGAPLTDYITLNEATSGAQLWYSSNDVGTVSSVSSGSANGIASTPGSKQAAPTAPVRKKVEPKEVFDEIKRETPEISFENLEEKIKVVTERINILKEHLGENHLRDEHQALFYLKNRLTYLKTMKKAPLDWAMTTQEAVDDLCKRYQLRVVPLKQYYTLVPKDGVREMDRYTKAYKAITGDNPIFELIIKDSDIKEEKKEQRKKDRDPIMVANSPLGDFLFIIGVWDDEVEIVDEIIYGLK